MQRLPNRRDFLRLTAGGTLSALLPEFAHAAIGADGSHSVTTKFFGLLMLWPTRQPYAENFPSISVGSWRAFIPELGWYSLEPSPGAWKFDKLDIAVRLMESRKIDVMLTLGETPAWASSEPTVKGPYAFGTHAPPRQLADWENYIRTVAQRYKGRIQAYELWNEPAVREVDGSKANFTAAQLVALGQSAYRIIKEVDPQARLTSPSMVGGEKGAARMDAYLAAGGDKCTDIISFHYYGLPEQIPQYHHALLKVMARHGLANLPVWNTEFGYLIEDPTAANTHPLSAGSFSRILPEQEGATWLARSLIIAASVGIERFFWFNWDGRNVGLTNFVGKRINAAGVAYGTVANWLINRRIGPMIRDGNVVSSPVIENGAITGHLVWTYDYKVMRWMVPKLWKATRIESVNGDGRGLSPSGEIEISASPVLVRSSS